MKLKHIVKSAFARFLLFFGKSTPLRVTHLITYRCNLKCKFCKLPVNMQELTTKEIKNKMLLFKKMGTLAWGFTGGEPFLRNDLPELLKFAKSECDFLTSVVTNGTLTEKISKIDGRHLDFLMISMEGGKEKTDEIRGKGTFDKVRKTMQTIKTKDIKTVSIDCVVQDNNLEAIKFIIELAKEFDIFCGFQPIFDPVTGKEYENIIVDDKKIESLKENIKYIIKQIEELKNKHIMTSFKFLKYCLNYGFSDFKKNKCYAGLLYCQMSPDDSIKNCVWYGKDGVQNFNQLKTPFSNCYCWAKCHSEYSAVFSFDISSVKNVIQKFV